MPVARTGHQINEKTTRAESERNKLDGCTIDSIISKARRMTIQTDSRQVQLRHLSRVRPATLLALGRTRTVVIRLIVASLSLATAPTVRAPAPVGLVSIAMVVVPTVLLFSIVGVRHCRLMRQRGVCNWARDILGRVIDVELLVDILRNRLDFGAQFLLNLVQVETVVPIDEVDREAQMPKTTGTTNTVEVRLRILGEVEVDDNVDSLDIDTTGQQIGADQVSRNAISEVVENAVAMLLQHSRMGIEA